MLFTNGAITALCRCPRTTATRGVIFTSRRAITSPTGDSSKNATEYYDSQSGKHVQLYDQIQTFFVPPATTTKFDKAQKVTCDFIMSKQQKEVQIIDVIVSDKKSESEALKTLSKVSKAKTKSTRCYINNAFSCDVYCLQSLAGALCDAGCDKLVLTDSAANMGQLGEYEIVEAIESVLYNDVVGEPMSMRLGLKLTTPPLPINTKLSSASSSSSGCGNNSVSGSNRENSSVHSSSSSSGDTDTHWTEHMATALQLNIKNFDVSFDGVGAPAHTEVQRIFLEAGLGHNLPIQ